MAELRTFLFTDICGSVRLKGTMAGRSDAERDQAFIQKILTPHRERIEEGLADQGGRVVSTAGDGHFLAFLSTISAAQWAVDVQRRHRDRPIRADNGEQVQVRISIHVGVPQVDPSDPDNFVGKSVDYAARLNDYATGGQILVSRSVMGILDDLGLEGQRFHSHGKRPLKGIGAVEIFELLYDDQAPRTMRHQPKSSVDRQWTVIPTQGYEADVGQGSDARRATETLPALKRVGNYELEELLGSGGMGDVYRARHVQFDRVRAVKVIKPQLVASGNPEIVRRFYNEIKAVGRLEHKNIVVAIDSSSPDDRVHYLVMEYIEGVGLDELVDRYGPLPIADACEIVRQAALGLQYIHKHDMVHRDIKPSNLILTLVDADAAAGDPLPMADRGAASGTVERGVVKILDLGLALLVQDNEERFTRLDGKAMGTGMYMSPEQWRTTSVDIRADIYSLGCTLYHLLAGNPPFYDSDLRPEKAHEKSAVPPIRTNPSPIPRKLQETLKKLLAKLPEDRYAEPSEAAAALAAFTSGHDLPKLYRLVKAHDPTSQSAWRTKVDSASQVDTLWSRVRQGTGELLTSRRWWLGAALPFFCVAVVSAIMAMRLLKIEEQQAAETRAHLTQIASVAAQTRIRDELSQRFDMLVAAARDKVVREQLKLINEPPAGETATLDERRKPLQVWLQGRYLDHQNAHPAKSWFVNDRRGIQVARAPNDEGTVGKNYSYRDYFHGGGRDLAKDDLSGIEPLKRPNLSAVYIGDSEGKLKVAFSVPVWSDDAHSTVLGVLSMSVDLGHFEVLDAKFRGNNDVVLIDLRDDYIDSEPRRGLILHHTRQGSWSKERRTPRIAREVLEAAAAEASGFVSGYRDPLEGESETRYWGAYEPVILPLGEEAGKMITNWVVLVQRPAKP